MPATKSNQILYVYVLGHVHTLFFDNGYMRYLKVFDLLSFCLFMIINECGNVYVNQFVILLFIYKLF